jgi:hypothetical protein
MENLRPALNRPPNALPLCRSTTTQAEYDDRRPSSKRMKLRAPSRGAEAKRPQQCAVGTNGMLGGSHRVGVAFMDFQVPSGHDKSSSRGTEGRDMRQGLETPTQRRK